MLLLIVFRMQTHNVWMFDVRQTEMEISTKEGKSNLKSSSNLLEMNKVVDAKRRLQLTGEH